jgi:hypothetical protein
MVHSSGYVHCYIKCSICKFTLCISCLYVPVYASMYRFTDPLQTVQISIEESEYACMQTYNSIIADSPLLGAHVGGDRRREVP